VLQVEETRITNSPGGVERREIRWRKATLDEAKMVLVSYHAQRKLLMTANFVVGTPTETGRNGRGEKDKLNEVSDSQTESPGQPSNSAQAVHAQAPQSPASRNNLSEGN
jgi:hypothetical protein